MCCLELVVFFNVGEIMFVDESVVVGLFVFFSFSYVLVDILLFVFDIMVGGVLCVFVVDYFECVVFVEVFGGGEGCCWIYVELFVDVECVVCVFVLCFDKGECVVVWVLNVFEWVLIEYVVGFVGVVFVIVNLVY